jgi:holliday junction DNA helicase RuvA
MIALLTGRVVSRSVALIEIETSGGTGYEVHIPLSVFEQLPPDGEVITLYTHLAVREDAWELFGFGSRLERSVFRRVLMAKGVGPALALGILSTIGAERVVEAIRTRDLATLVRVPRVGRRKAEQIVLDLAEKMDDLAIGDSTSAPVSTRSTPQGGSSRGTDAVRALVALGYAEPEALSAVRRAGAHGDVAATVRAALALLNE